MSAKRSFDVSAKKKESKEPAPKRRRRRKPSKESAHPVLSTRNTKRKLRDRRRDAFFAKAWLGIFAVLTLVAGILYLFWLPGIRITHVEASGYGDPGAIASIAREELKGTYYSVIPRDSFFFYPERTIREKVLERFPAISSVSVGRNGFDSIMLEGHERVPAFLWCGSPDALAADDTTCYEADTEGLVFEKADVDASSTPMLHAYAELDMSSSTDAYPLRGRVKGAESLPEILRFVRSIGTLGVTVASVAIRGDEADLFVAPATRITYVVGHEKEAMKSAEAAFPKLNLADGSLLYVDLRFDGKVYLKRVGE